MRTRAGMMLAALGVMVGAGSAEAVGVGGTLYVRTRNTRLVDKPSPTARVVMTLQPPAEVVWEGADAKSRQWHRVKVGRLSGYVFQSNLATRPPDMELRAGAGAGKVDPQAVASSGAAVKALTSGELGKGGRQVSLQQAAEQVEALWRVARVVQDSYVIEHVQRAGLKPVVLPRSTSARPPPTKGSKGSAKGGKS